MKTLIRVCKYICIIGVALWLVSAIFLVEIGPDEIGIRQSNVSGVGEEDLSPGWAWRVPGVHKIIRLPSTYTFLDYTPDDVGPQRSLEIRTKDNNNITVDITVPVRIKEGYANKIVGDGNHVSDKGRYRYQILAENAAVSVLRGQLAKLDSVGFYTTETRLDVSETTLETLNESLDKLHLEAGTVLIRAVRFRPEYERQKQQIQLNEQNKLLDQAKERVADQQQKLDNYQQATNAQAAALEQDWVKQRANLERAYEVGFIDVQGDNKPGAARALLVSLSDEKRLAMQTAAAEVLNLESAEEANESYLLGIKNIEAETREYAKRMTVEAESVSARLKAEGDAQVAKVRGAFESQLNALLSSPAGRAYVAWKSAEYVTFNKTLIFNSSDGIPSVLKLRQFAQQFMGGR